MASGRHQVPSLVNCLPCFFRLIDALSHSRQYAAPRNRDRGITMPIGEFGRPPAMPSEVSPALTTPMYWMYEMGQASLNPARAMADMTKLMFENPLKSVRQHRAWKIHCGRLRIVRAHHAPLRQTRMGLHDTEVNGMRVPVEIKTVWKSRSAGCSISNASSHSRCAHPQPRVLNRGADVGALCDAAARHGGSLPARP